MSNITIFTSDLHKKHSALSEIFNGKEYISPEKPDRIDNILAQTESLVKYGLVSKIDEELVLKIHTPDYINFLKSLNSFDQDKLYPSVWNYSKYISLKPEALEIEAGNYVFDTFTPFTQNIWEAALESANLAFSAAKFSLDTHQIGYALCRPPGHHATASKAGGYCYLANSSLVAQFLVDQGKKPCVLDIDFHHGNGTQEIWYESSQVLTISIHKDPSSEFPYYSGFENEVGFGKGVGWNYNFCLPTGTKESEYLQVLDLALDKIAEKNCDYIIISAGFDTYKLDPICDFALEIESYAKIAAKIKKSLNLPTVILQEGGYNLEDLGACVYSFLKAL